jgi:hypothetical protein
MRRMAVAVCRAMVWWPRGRRPKPPSLGLPCRMEELMDGPGRATVLAIRVSRLWS